MEAQGEMRVVSMVDLVGLDHALFCGRAETPSVDICTSFTYYFSSEVDCLS
jgi:hypothetical protein